jgi:hypothetical protein
VLKMVETEKYKLLKIDIHVHKPIESITIEGNTIAIWIMCARLKLEELFK